MKSTNGFGNDDPAPYRERDHPARAMTGDPVADGLTVITFPPHVGLAIVLIMAAVVVALLALVPDAGDR